MNHCKRIKAPISIKIAGIGCYEPTKLVVSKEIEEECGLEPGWCANNLGVEQRRWIKEETPSFMGAEAAKEAISQANLELEDIDLILNASGTANFEQGLPDCGPLIQKQLGLENSGIPSFTIQNNDLSFLFALEASAAWLNTGRYENILVVSSEIFSLNLDNKNPEVYGLFGDGAASVLVTSTPEKDFGGIHYIKQHTYGDAAHSLQSIMGFSAAKHNQLVDENLTVQMNPQSFKANAQKYTQELLKEIVPEEGPNLNDVDWVIPQSIGKFYIDFLVSQVGIPREKIITTQQHLGFCGAASLPMNLYQAIKTDKLKRNDLCLLLGAGAGMAVGGIIFTY